MEDRLDGETLRVVLDRLGGDTYNRPPETITWSEIWEHVQWLEDRARKEGMRVGKDGARKAMRCALGMETWKP